MTHAPGAQLQLLLTATLLMLARMQPAKAVTTSTIVTKQVHRAVVVAQCPDPSDCTASLQKALDTPYAERVVVPLLDGGKRPWLVSHNGSQLGAVVLGPMASHRTIEFESGVTLLAARGDFHSTSAYLVLAQNATNVTIVGDGATWQMWKRDYADTRRYSHSQNRHALAMFGCDDMIIRGLTIRSSGGDGVYISGLSNGSGPKDDAKGYSKNVLLLNVHSDDNYRQGMSVISVVGLRVVNSVFSRTNGTSPAAGIDFEPNDSNDRLEDIHLENVTIVENSGNAIDICPNGLGGRGNAPLVTPFAMTEISMHGLVIDGGHGGGIYWAGGRGTSHLLLEDVVIKNTMLAGLMLELVATPFHHATLRNVVMHNVSANYSGQLRPRRQFQGGWTSVFASSSPIVLGDPEYGGFGKGAHYKLCKYGAGPCLIGGLLFKNVTIHDYFRRPWAAYVGRPGSAGAGDIMGNVRVVKPNLSGGCWHTMGKERLAGGVVLIDVDVDCRRDYVS